jgi:hypothetical protein
MSRVDDVVRAAETLLDSWKALGGDSRKYAVDETGISQEMAEHVFVTACSRYQRKQVESLSNTKYDGMHVCVVLAASVATAPLRAIALPWLARAARVSVRASRSQRKLVDVFVRAFGCDEIAMVDEIPGDASVVSAYGSDDTLEVIRRKLPPGTQWEAKGHGVGVALADTMDDVQRVAMDVVMYDQRGCLSPQMVLVREDALAFGRALFAELVEIEKTLPRGVVTLEEGSLVAQWQGVNAAQCEWFRRAKTCSVGVSHEARWVASPGMRNVVVCTVRSVEDVLCVVGDQSRYITCVGCSDVWKDIRTALPQARVVSLGTMQDPPLDGPEDLRRNFQAIDGLR